MGDLIDSSEKAGQTLNLEQAYESAVWSTPEIRQQLLSEQANDADGKRQKEMKLKTSKAKKSDKINLKTTGSYDEKAPKPTGSINDTLRETLKKIQGSEE